MRASSINFVKLSINFVPAGSLCCAAERRDAPALHVSLVEACLAFPGFPCVVSVKGAEFLAVNFPEKLSLPYMEGTASRQLGRLDAGNF